MKTLSNYLGLFDMKEENLNRVLAGNIQKDSAKELSVAEVEATITKRASLEENRKKVEALKKAKEVMAKKEEAERKKKETEELDAIYAGKTYKKEITAKRKVERTVIIKEKTKLEIRTLRTEMFSDIHKQTDLISFIKGWLTPGLKILVKYKNKNHLMKNVIKEAIETVNFTESLHSTLKALKPTSVKDEIGSNQPDVLRYCTDLFKTLARKHIVTVDDIYTIALIWTIEGMVELRRHRISEVQILTLVLGFAEEIENKILIRTPTTK